MMRVVPLALVIASFANAQPAPVTAPATAPAPPASADTPAPDTPAAEPSPADIERARALYQAGSAAYQSKQYAVAVEAFEEAFRLAPRSSVMYSLAQAHRLKYYLDGDIASLRRSVELYRAYLGAPESGSRLDDAEQHLKDMVPQLQDAEATAADPRGRIIVSAEEPDATARVGDGEPHPIPATFQLDPGRYAITITAPGYLPQTVDTSAVTGSVTPLNITLTPQPGELTVRAPEGARVAIDGRTLGLAPLPPVSLAPGTHRVVVTDRGRVPFVQTVQLERTQAVALEAPLEITEQRVAAWIMIGGAAALAVGAGVAAGFALDAQSEAEEISDRFGRDPLTVDDADRFQDLVDTRDDRATLAIGLGAGAVVLGTAGALLWVFDNEEAPPAPIITPTVGPTGAAVTGRWRF